jgi:hypothetical protein
VSFVSFFHEKNIALSTRWQIVFLPLLRRCRWVNNELFGHIFLAFFLIEDINLAVDMFLEALHICLYAATMSSILNISSEEIDV